MAKAKSKKKRKKAKQENGSQNGEIILYSPDLVAVALTESALAAKMVVLSYSRQFKTRRAQVPLEELAQRVEAMVLEAFALEIEDAASETV
jgi:hypothetical protein